MAGSREMEVQIAEIVYRRFAAEYIVKLPNSDEALAYNVSEIGPLLGQELPRGFMVILFSVDGRYVFQASAPLA